MKGQGFEAAGELAHLVSSDFFSIVDRLPNGAENKILEHLDIGWVDHLRINFDRGDVAGAGGTSWARVEQVVRYGEVRYPGIAEWGVPTAQALQEVRATLPGMALVASGGIRSGMDAANAIALGADVVALARPLLAPAIESAAAVVDVLGGFIEELRVCLHCCGVADLEALRRIGATSRE